MVSDLNWTTYNDQISNLLVIPSSDPNFVTMLPGMRDYAEQRIYRELDLLAVQITDATTTVSSGNRNFTVPTTLGTFIIIDNVNIITPSTATADTGSRTQLLPVSREFMDMCYGGTLTGVPEFFAMASNDTILFGPAPDAGYVAEVIGIQRPEPLTAMNSSTILTRYVPDLFIAASMIFGSAYMREFSVQGPLNPGMGQSWEGQYQTLFKSAETEQFRAKFQSAGWTSQTPSPLAQRQ